MVFARDVGCFLGAFTSFIMALIFARQYFLQNHRGVFWFRKGYMRVPLFSEIPTLHEFGRAIRVCGLVQLYWSRRGRGILGCVGGPLFHLSLLIANTLHASQV